MLIVVQQGGLGRKLRRLRKSSCLRIAFSQQGQAQPNLKFWTLKIPFWVRRQSGTPYTCESQSWAEWRRRRQFTYIELCLVRCKHWSVHLEIVILLHIGRRRGVGIDPIQPQELLSQQAWVKQSTVHAYICTMLAELRPTMVTPPNNFRTQVSLLLCCPVNHIVTKREGLCVILDPILDLQVHEPISESLAEQDHRDHRWLLKTLLAELLGVGWELGENIVKTCIASNIISEITK